MEVVPKFLISKLAFVLSLFFPSSRRASSLARSAVLFTNDARRGGTNISYNPFTKSYGLYNPTAPDQKARKIFFDGPDAWGQVTRRPAARITQQQAH